MLHCFDPIRTLSFWAILVRLTLAVVCGGVIGAERETKRRPAGFRTHILICLVLPSPRSQASTCCSPCTCLPTSRVSARRSSPASASSAQARSSSRATSASRA